MARQHGSGGMMTLVGPDELADFRRTVGVTSAEALSAIETIATVAARTGQAWQGEIVPRALHVCSVPGCPELTTGGRCQTHRRQADRARGTHQQRGYGRRHQRRFRAGVLRRDPLCVCTDTSHGHGPRCLRPSTVADHWPRDRRELVRLGLDPDDPQYGRGLCKTCHDKHTARTQPGGWNQR